MAVKVMITDDHSLIREGLKQLLELEGELKIKGFWGITNTCRNNRCQDSCSYRT